MLKKAGRYFYKKTGLKNPIKKGKLSSSRVYNNASKIARVASEVAILRRLVNAEKKRYEFTVVNNAVAQVDGNTTGCYVRDITPVMSEGITASTRNGASIKWTSSYINMQFIHQSATQSAIKGKIYFVKVKNQIINNTTFISTFLNQNRFTTSGVVYDLYSTRQQDYFKDYIVLKTVPFKVECDQLSGQTVCKNLSIPLKFGHHVKFQGDTNTLTDGQVFMLIVTDSGNMNASTISTVGNIPVTAVSTGLNLCYNCISYYVDN